MAEVRCQFAGGYARSATYVDDGVQLSACCCMVLNDPFEEIRVVAESGLGIGLPLSCRVGAEGLFWSLTRHLVIGFGCWF